MRYLFSPRNSNSAKLISYPIKDGFYPMKKKVAY